VKDLKWTFSSRHVLISLDFVETQAQPHTRIQCHSCKAAEHLSCSQALTCRIDPEISDIWSPLNLFIYMFIGIYIVLYKYIIKVNKYMNIN
jgi:hypothetical protein